MKLTRTVHLWELRSATTVASCGLPGKWQDVGRHLASQKLRSLWDEVFVWNRNPLIFQGASVGFVVFFFHKLMRENILSFTNISFSPLCFAFYIEARNTGKIILKHSSPPLVSENQEQSSRTYVHKGDLVFSTSLCLVSSGWQCERHFNTWNNLKSVKLEIAIILIFSGYLLARSKK